MSKKKLPDSYVPNAYALSYGSNLSAPVIKPDHSLGGWKVGAVHSANKHYEERFDKIKKELEKLAEDVKWNEIIFNAEMRMKPVIGNIYHLYKKDSGKYFMSLFAPEECSWGEKHEGSFRLNYDNRWDIV
tara:strand:+ start:2416 stop:2805 length:390 start_codon:yes stop_codon:yes gene_type:complete